MEGAARNMLRFQITAVSLGLKLSLSLIQRRREDIFQTISHKNKCPRKTHSCFFSPSSNNICMTEEVEGECLCFCFGGMGRGGVVWETHSIDSQGGICQLPPAWCWEWGWGGGGGFRRQLTAHPPPPPPLPTPALRQLCTPAVILWQPAYTAPCDPVICLARSNGGATSCSWLREASHTPQSKLNKATAAKWEVVARRSVPAWQQQELCGHRLQRQPPSQHPPHSQIDGIVCFNCSGGRWLSGAGQSSAVSWLCWWQEAARAEICVCPNVWGFYQFSNHFNWGGISFATCHFITGLSTWREF